MENKVIKIVRENKRVEVEYKNVDTLEILSLVVKIVAELLKDMKEQKGFSSYGLLLEAVEDMFSAKSLDFIVNNDGSPDFEERAVAFIMEEISAYEKEEADDQ